jgi:hypothetical protein
MSLTPDQIVRLQALALELKTQDNAFTADPVFIVQRRVRDFGIEIDYREVTAWIDCEGTVVTKKDDPERFEEFEECAEGYDQFDDADGTGWLRTGYRERWEFVQAFLTRRAAEEFRVEMAHRIGTETRVYTESAFANYEWKFLRALITQLGGT